MFTLETLRQELLQSEFNFNNITKKELFKCDSIIKIFKILINEAIYYGKSKINLVNTYILLSISSSHDNYINGLNFILDVDENIWRHISISFDDIKIKSLIQSLFLCIKNNYISIDKIIKLYEILFSNKRFVYILIEMNIFCNLKLDLYSNIYNTFLGILINRVSISCINYDYRINKISKLFYILINNKITRNKFLKWISYIVNLSKKFKNDYLYLEYNNNTITPKYFRLFKNILLKLWENTTKKEKNKFENIDMEYPKNKFSLVNIDKRKLEFKINNKFLNDLFFMIVVILNNYYNNLELIINNYIKEIEEIKIQYRQIVLNENITYESKFLLNKITLLNIEKEKLEYCKKDDIYQNIKKFQKNCGEIINLNLKRNINIPEIVLDTNIDLINNLKIFNDCFYNFNFLNFENSIILIDYEKLRNPYLKHKYCFYACYYISDNVSKNNCDLRFKSIQNIIIINLVNFYIELEKLEEEIILEKLLIRVNIINFFNFIFSQEPKIYKKKLKKYNIKINKRFIKFLNFCINDISKQFDNTIDIIRDIFLMESENIIVSLNSENEYINMYKHIELLKKYNLLKTQLFNLDNMISFLHIISENSINILMSKEIGEKICGRLNYFLNELTCKDKRKLYNIKNKYDIDFNSINLINSFIKIYILLIEHPNFTLYMSNDIRFFKKNNIFFSINTLFSNNLLNEFEYNKIQKITISIDKMIKMNKEIEIPDEFCDPLMACEIIEPIILPNTNTIMEKSVILRHLLNNLNNPFNREPLTLEELEEYNNKEDIKKKIQIFNTKKEEWKNKLII